VHPCGDFSDTAWPRESADHETGLTHAVGIHAKYCSSSRLASKETMIVAKYQAAIRELLVVQINQFEIPTFSDVRLSPILWALESEKRAEPIF
jgi:hypothetical protein